MILDDSLPSCHSSEQVNDTYEVYVSTFKSKSMEVGVICKNDSSMSSMSMGKIHILKTEKRVLFTSSFKEEAYKIFDIYCHLFTSKQPNSIDELNRLFRLEMFS